MPELNKEVAKIVAQSVGKAKKQLDFALEGMWDARNRDNAEDFAFYQDAVGRYSLSLVEWVSKLTMKSGKEE